MNYAETLQLLTKFFVNVFHVFAGVIKRSLFGKYIACLILQICGYSLVLIVLGITLQLKVLSASIKESKEIKICSFVATISIRHSSGNRVTVTEFISVPK